MSTSRSLYGSPALPLDILHTIIEKAGELPSPDYRTLRALASTCYVLRPICQKQIFFQILLCPWVCDTENAEAYDYILDDKWAKEVLVRVGNMERIVRSNPEIATYVRILRVETHPPNDDARFPRLVSQFNNINRLYIKRRAHNVATWDWVGIDVDEVLLPPWSDDESAQSLCKFQFPSVTAISMCNFMNIPPSVLVPCTNLMCLRITGSSAFAEGEPSGSPSSDYLIPIQLETLEFYRYKSIAPLLSARRPNGAPIICISMVTSLSFNFHGDYEQALIELLRGMSHLTSLSIMVPRDKKANLRNIVNSINPSSVAKLEYLELQVVLCNPAYNHAFPTELLQILSTQLKVLTDLTLNVLVPKTQYRNPLYKDFRKLDELFATPQFPALCQVHISIVLLWATFDLAKWDSLEVDCLPRLLRNPTVKLEVEVDDITMY